MLHITLSKNKLPVSKSKINLHITENHFA